MNEAVTGARLVLGSRAEALTLTSRKPLAPRKALAVTALVGGRT